MKDRKCFCIESAFNAVGDLQNAFDRMFNSIKDHEMRQYLKGYIDGVNAVGERFRVTQGQCCCKRALTTDPGDRGEI